MDTQTKEWKRSVERLWSASDFDYREAAQLAAEMRHSNMPALRDSAAQALPTLRHACLKSADRMTKNLAHRRFGAIRNALHTLAAPRFGKRYSAEQSSGDDEDHRRRLGLPLGRRLFGPDIQQAYKRAAKKVHPDAGGSEREFLALSQARDALMREIVGETTEL
jgi:hypothetical protein